MKASYNVMNRIRTCISFVIMGTTAVAVTHITPPDYFMTEDSPVLLGFAPAESEPPVDAFKEADFYRTTFYIHRIPDLSPGQHAPDDTSDLLGTISGTYTDEGLYIYLEVIDDIIFVDSLTMPWNDDNIEILIDPDESRNVRFDGVNDSKYVVELKGDGIAEVVQGVYPVPAQGGDWSRFDAAFTITENGYDVEFFFPWEGLQVYPFGVWRMGIEVEINDDDGTGVRESWITLSSFGVPNNNTHQYATAELWADKHVVIAPKENEQTITMDGEREDAYNSGIQYQSSGRPGKLMAPLENETAVNWTVLYDDAFLYFHFDISDSAFVIDSGDDYWNDDSFYLLIEGAETVIVAFAPQADGSVVIHTSGDFPDAPAGTSFDGLEAAYVLTDSGWSLEVKVALATYGLTEALAGESLRIDFQLQDDDDGGEADHTLTWNAGVEPFDRPGFWAEASFFAPVTAAIQRTTKAVGMTSGVADTAFAVSPWREVSRPLAGQSVYPFANNVFGARWKAVHDEAFLYLLVEINDKALRSNDGIEIAMGRELGGGEMPELLDEVLLQMRRNTSGSIVIETLSGTNLNGMQAVSWRSDLGYIIKSRIPFASLGISPGGNRTIEFDLRVRNDHDSGSDHFKGWSSIGTNLAEAAGWGRIELDASSYAGSVGAVRYENGWYRLPSFGWFNEKLAQNGWIYRHGGLQWLYPFVSAEASSWFYSPALASWIFTSDEIFPNMWIADGRGWMSLDVSGRSIYSYAEEIWTDLDSTN